MNKTINTEILKVIETNHSYHRNLYSVFIYFIRVLVRATNNEHMRQLWEACGHFVGALTALWPN